MKKNKDTEENRAFWKFVEDTAERVSHWPKSQGGGGVKPLHCPSCNQQLPEEKA
jgi:hypothetical protein